MSSETRHAGTLPYVMALPAAGLLLTYAIFNGMPFVYPDSFVYLAYGNTAWIRVHDVLMGSWQAVAQSGTATSSGEDAAWAPQGGRSIFYALLATLPSPGPVPWAGVVVQAYCAAVPVAIAWRVVTGSVGPMFLVAMAILGTVTTFGVFSATVMPDVWAAIGPFSLALILAFSDKLARHERIALWCLVLFAATAHSTHFAVLAILAVLVAAIRAAGAPRPGWSQIGILGSVLTISAMLDAGAMAAMERAAGRKPFRMPFLTAHLVDGGPGTDFARDACPDAGFAICERVDDLPVEWRQFLFQLTSNPPGFRERVTEEDVAFAIATFRHDPAAVIALSVRDALRQVGMIGLVTIPIRADTDENAVLEKSADPFANGITQGRLYHARQFWAGLSLLNTFLTVTSATILFSHVWRMERRLPGNLVAFSTFLVICLAGLLANAVICGVLASPYDRFQARVSWLVALLAVISLVARHRSRDTTARYDRKVFQ